MTAKLSILGLPLGESMRCKLFDGFPVAVANRSNPTVAFTRSRKSSRWLAYLTKQQSASMFIPHFAPVKEVRAGLNYFANTRGVFISKWNGVTSFAWPRQVSLGRICRLLRARIQKTTKSPTERSSPMTAVAQQTGSGTTAIRPFPHVNVPESELDDLRRRIKATRWPTKELVADQSQGVQLATTQALASYWATEYDWRKVEARLNATTAVRHRDRWTGHSVHPRPSRSTKTRSR